MSEKNVEIVKRVFDQWNRGEGVADEDVHPDAVIISRGLMEGRVVRGREGAHRLFQEIEEQFDEWSITVDEWHDAGDCVALLVRVHLHGRQSGIAFDQPVGYLVEVRDGQLYRFETFLDNPADALEAAGLRE
jgi:ketosteroid isomerase-like protein